MQRAGTNASVSATVETSIDSTLQREILIRASPELPLRTSHGRVDVSVWMR